MPSIEETVRLQRVLGMGDTHIVFLDEEQFYLAHTDAERAVKDEVPLDECPVHVWLSSESYFGPAAEAVGHYYTAVKCEHDPTSESHRSDAQPYILTRLDVTEGKLQA